MNELINDEAVYRTAPATQGLLNSITRLICQQKRVWSGQSTPALQNLTQAQVCVSCMWDFEDQLL